MMEIAPGTEIAVCLQPRRILEPPYHGGFGFGGWDRGTFMGVDDRCEPHWLVLKRPDGSLYAFPQDDVLDMGVISA